LNAVLSSPPVSEFVDVCAVEEIPANRPIMRAIEGRRIALCRTASGVHALDNTCPHRGGPLAEGDIIGEEIVCPWHLWAFDVRSGWCPGSTTVGVAAHDVKIENGRVLVRLSPPRSLPELL
jgi:nitrite reductase/ring-hydroxylating ferredoxin subunit